MMKYVKYISLIFSFVLAVPFVMLSQQQKVEQGMVFIKGGKLKTKDLESGKQIEKQLKPFYIDKNLVTVKEYKEFVRATGYKTEAEKFGNSTVFNFKTGEWEMVEGATFLFPFGPNGEPAKDDHPVTQVSWNDAYAYARWKGKRLPTAAEWEWAARAAENDGTDYAWGPSLVYNGKYKANTWQGNFPYRNTKEDGFLTTSPVGYFGSTKIGLNDMGGNVWQWCYDKVKPTPQEALTDTATRRVTKGGSFLCDPEVCHGFRVNGKSSSTAETGMVHTGFRCVKSAQ